MQIYMVGGAVRDTLLGLPVIDHDWVVVGSTPEALTALGYQPVGKDFPVFLHPVTREEFALARTERKTARGYRGFEVHAAPDVTLEQDLARRDLTINSIAVPATESGTSGTFNTDYKSLIDPYGGQKDIADKVLRHVTDAFREDPVRILRVARFAARFANFSVAPETLQLMKDMVQHGEVDALVAERVWQELARGLMEAHPSRLLQVLQQCGALYRLLPELQWGSDSNLRDRSLQVMQILDLAARLSAPLPVRFACLIHAIATDRNRVDGDSLLHGACERLRVPLECRDTAVLVAREHGNIDRSGEWGAAELTRLLTRCDAYRKPRRFADVLLACECVARGRPGQHDAAYPQRTRLMSVLVASQSVITSEIAAQAQAAGLDGRQIGEKIDAARVLAVAAVLQTL